MKSSGADSILAHVIAAAGGPSALARALGISPQAVCQWKRVPPLRAQAVHDVTGIPPAVLRPDIFGKAAVGERAGKA